MSICDHNRDRGLDNLVNGIVGAHRAEEKAHSVSSTCDRCDTEALVEIFECVNELALAITKWIDPGAGLTPDDPQWQKQMNMGFGNIIQSSPIKRHKGNVSAVKASARACFESASVDSLRSRNIAFLKDQRFKRSMIYRPSILHEYTWYLFSKHR
ncbi:uncharacterized protein N7529_000611 [Penicillium soppii]|uniref:uncharacterized protein n=1 Tax=Penicillium soppii TaxID=69789 RepID=UPI0025471318|nr:uncharacterized protein N7529_000611 [Penicillium soppii]KAJ5881939.1 hypothetical protein N7529_000611 [Penicillium soppii]